MTEPDLLLDALQSNYGYDAFRPQQRETIEHVRGGGDALVLMPTGGGKSLCYQLPAMLSDGLTVVVSPLIALMHDQVTALQRAGASAHYLNSTLSPMETAQVERSVLNGEVKLLYVAPERVNTDRFRALLEQRNPSLIAIDEAHCISEWGHEFRPDYRVLRRLTERFVDVPTVACTATATPQVQRDIVDQLDRPRMQTFITSFMRDNLTLRIVPKRKAVDQLVARLKRLSSGSAIVYCLSRKNTEKTAADLRGRGITAECYHAGMNGAERHAVQNRFLSGETPVICATIAFGMGIDKPDIRLVAHLDMPSSVEAYYQEIGRAGRDGEPSECLLFYTKGVWHQRMFFIRDVQDETERESRIKRLRTMMSFCEQSQCRWATILKYFGEQPQSDQCGHCSNCLGEQDQPPAQSTRAVDPAAPPDPPGRGEPSPLSAEEDRLYEALRERRYALSKQHAVSAFVIASNRELAELTRLQPTTLSELRRIKGFVGGKRADRFGEALVEVIRNSVAEDSPTFQQEREPDMATSDDAPPEDWQQRFNALAEWRTATSADEQCDPSDLLSFAAMRQLAESPPASREALAAVEGVGAVAVERHADRLLELLGNRSSPAPAPSSPSRERGEETPSWQISADLYEDGHTILAIAERRMLSPATVASHLTTALRHGQEVDLKRSLPPVEVVQEVRRLVGEDPDASIAKLHERLEHRLSRPEVSIVHAYLRPPERIDE